MIATRAASRIFLIVTATLATSCSKSALPTETSVDGATSTAPSAAVAKREKITLIRFINATQGPKDLYFQDMPAFTKVEYGTITPYSPLPSPRSDSHHELKLYNATSTVGTPLISDSESEISGQRYTVLALSQNGKFTLSVIPDRLKAPAAGKTKVRLIHAAPGVDKLDIFRAGETTGIFNGQSFDRFTEYKEIAPANTELAVRKRGSKTDEVKLKDVKLEAGKLYTIILLGGEGKPLSSKVIEDEFVAVDVAASR